MIDGQNPECSRTEQNLRRRIYDAWNVLKAACIIKEIEEKLYVYDRTTLEDDEDDEEEENIKSDDAENDPQDQQPNELSKSNKVRSDGELDQTVTEKSEQE